MPVCLCCSRMGLQDKQQAATISRNNSYIRFDAGCWRKRGPLNIPPLSVQPLGWQSFTFMNDVWGKSLSKVNLSTLICHLAKVLWRVQCIQLFLLLVLSSFWYLQYALVIYFKYNVENRRNKLSKYIFHLWLNIKMLLPFLFAGVWSLKSPSWKVISVFFIILSTC